MIKRVPFVFPRCRWRGADGTPCSADARWELRQADTHGGLEDPSSKVGVYCGRHIGSAEHLQRAIERQQKGRFSTVSSSGSG